MRTLICLLVWIVCFFGQHLQPSQAWSFYDFFSFWREHGPSDLLGTMSPVCYGELGCFKKFVLGNEWKIPVPVSFYPQSPDEINVQFKFFSCHQQYNPVTVDFNSTFMKICPSRLNFDPNLRTVILVHGFRDSFDQFDWMGNIKDFLVNKPCRYNVIGVDWRKGSQIKNYIQAVANTQVVGATIASLVKKLNQVYKLTNENFTIVGHSLGAHISGFAGKRLQKPVKVRNIIGLDPAGPAFSDLPESERLNPSDAQLVLTIHTNGGPSVTDGFGLAKPIGHFSFFPNGGLDQPGCEKVQGITNILLNGVEDGLTDTIACSHRRATHLIYYNESLYSDFHSIAFECQNYSHFLQGKCADAQNNALPFFGWFDFWQHQTPSLDWKSPVSFFIDTSDRIPFTLLHYRVEIATDNDFQPVEGVLKLQLHGVQRNDAKVFVQFENKFQPNSFYSYLFKVKKNLGKIKQIDVDFVETENTFNKNLTENLKQFGVALKIKQIKVSFMSATTERKRLINSSILKHLNWTSNSNGEIRTQTFKEFASFDPYSRVAEISDQGCLIFSSVTANTSTTTASNF